MTTVNIRIYLTWHSLITIFELLKEEKPEPESDVIPAVDDRISPYENQGLTVEIKRIRNRGLMDKMLTFGTDWKNKPTFFWKCSVDGKEHIADKMWSAGGVEGTGSFTEWDTLGKESKGNFYVEEEQETSKVKITILEKVKSGLLFKRETDIEKETIDLVYDYRTGRWSGDDYFKDRDGYGHVRRDEYEIWFNLKPGSDFLQFFIELPVEYEPEPGCGRPSSGIFFKGGLFAVSFSKSRQNFRMLGDNLLPPFGGNLFEQTFENKFIADKAQRLGQNVVAG